MRLLNLKNPFAVWPVKHRIPGELAAQRYRLSVICESSELYRMVDLLLLELAPVGMQPQHIRREEAKSRHLAKIVATVVCTTQERAALVRFVNRAGMIEGVRNVCWESVPRDDSAVLY